MRNDIVYKLVSTIIFIVWNSNEVEVWSSFSDDHLLLIHRKFITSNEKFYLVNVYAPCDLVAQRIHWTRLSALIGKYADKNIGLCGDFNAVRSIDERRGVGAVQRVVGCATFNNFIDPSLLVDLPLVLRGLGEMVNQ